MRCVFSAVIAITIPLEAWTLLRATQIDSPAIQKRADISAHERVKPEVTGSVFSSPHMARKRGKRTTSSEIWVDLKDGLTEHI